MTQEQENEPLSESISTNSTDSKIPVDTKPPPPNAWAFVVPFIAFMLIATQYPQFEPNPDPTPSNPLNPASASLDQESESVIASDEATAIAVQPNPVAAKWYQTLVGVQVLVGFVLLSFWMRTYLAHFPFRVSGLAVVVGAIGIALWVGVTSLGIEARFMELIGFPQKSVARAAFNPYFEIQSDQSRYIFLGLRFTLLAMIVPIVEELFLRGWLVRWIESAEDWNLIKLSGLAFGAIITATVYGVLTHPSEAIAAALWFSLVTWLMLKTGNFWDCVVAHAVTNLLLGIWILYTAQWHLW